MPVNLVLPRATGRLTDKVAIVTGGGTQGAGIGNGRAAAVIFAREGARVAVVDIDQEAANATLTMIRDQGGDGVALAADVSDERAVAGAVSSVADRWGRLDILQNNVGIAGPRGSAVDVDLDAWDRVMRVNVKSMVVVARYCVPLMAAGGGGSIVNVSSVAGLVASQVPKEGEKLSILSYHTSKGAIVNLTRSMAADHGPQGIRVNCVAPGYVYTPLVEKDMTPERREARRLASPLRTEGTAWDVAMASLFLASDEARWITGVVLPVDAGLTAACLPPLS